MYYPDLTERPLSNTLIVKAVGGAGSTAGMPLTISLLLPEKMPREKILCLCGQTELHTAHMESIFRLWKEETVMVALRYRFSSPLHLAQKELPGSGC